MYGHGGCDGQALADALNEANQRYAKTGNWFEFQENNTKHIYWYNEEVKRNAN